MGSGEPARSNIRRRLKAVSLVFDLSKPMLPVMIVIMLPDFEALGLKCKISNLALRKLALVTEAGTWRPSASWHASPDVLLDIATMASGFFSKPKRWNDAQPKTSTGIISTSKR